MKIKDYAILCDGNVRVLINTIIKYSHDGYEINGAPFAFAVSDANNGKTSLCQALVLYDKEG